ncbi:C40 family peptidase [Flavobacterium sp. '19STA2R22 D10 B1']|uniref:C40 family peptidase n=1 Tax=Flavobacterium aerium TaxID=3037261 RepID=UPI00278BD8CC|nr:C40 family peptidase [Flavobacterium sp. '19STA2R22 D10 B1']
MKAKILYLFTLSLLVISCGSKKGYGDPITDEHAIKELGLDKERKPVEKKAILLTNEERVYFAKTLGVTPQEITNEKLYKFIKEWEGIPYVYGGTNKKGIDCSALMQELFDKVYDEQLPRTASEMALGRDIELFQSFKELKEGDLIFFRMNNEKVISHVGIYLKNMRFFAANQNGGVEITSLKKPYWRNNYISSGRLKDTK